MRIILVLILGLYSQFSFAQWSKLNSGTTEELNAIYFVDSNIGFTCGKNGYVGKTINGGSSWTDVSLSNAFNLFDLYFIDSLKGYVVGLNALIYKTTDGGLSWQEDRPITGESDLKSISFKDSTYGVAVGTEGKIFIYKNQAWSKQSLSSRTNLNDVEINSDGFAVIGADSGKIYTKKQNDNSFIPYPGYSSTTPFTTVQFLDSVLYLSGGWYDDSLMEFTSHVLKSLDTGQFFSVLNTKDLEEIKRFHIVTEDKAYYLGRGTAFYNLEDNFSMKYRIFPATNNSLNNFHFLTKDIVFACGVAGTIVKTNHSPGWNTNINALNGNDLVYPNPTKDYLYINSKTSIKEIRLYDSHGKIVLSQVNKEGTIDVIGLKNGFYTLEIKDIKGQLRRTKIIKF